MRHCVVMGLVRKADNFAMAAMKSDLGEQKYVILKINPLPHSNDPERRRF